MIGNTEWNSVGGGFPAYGGGFGGGFGGIAPFGLFGLAGLGGLGGFGGHGHGGHEHGCGHGGDHSTVAAFALANGISNVKDSIASAKDSLSLGISTAKDSIQESMMDISKEVCDVSKDVLTAAATARYEVAQGFYNQAIANIANTQSIKDQAQVFQIANDRKFEELSREGDRNTAIILAKLNQTEIDRLRDELDLTRRGRDSRDLEINIQNTAIAQQQQQQQIRLDDDRRRDFDRKFDILFSQVAKSSQDVINIGGLMAGVAQTANPVNVKS